MSETDLNLVSVVCGCRCCRTVAQPGMGSQFLVMLTGVLLLLVLATSSVSAKSKPACPTLVIRNGTAKLRRKGTRVKFRCYKGFTRVGPKKANCVRGKWKPGRVPVCVKPGCDTPQVKLKRICPSKLTWTVLFWLKTCFDMAW